MAYRAYYFHVDSAEKRKCPMPANECLVRFTSDCAGGVIAGNAISEAAAPPLTHSINECSTPSIERIEGFVNKVRSNPVGAVCGQVVNTSFFLGLLSWLLCLTIDNEYYRVRITNSSFCVSRHRLDYGGHTQGFHTLKGAR